MFEVRHPTAEPCIKSMQTKPRRARNGAKKLSPSRVLAHFAVKQDLRPGDERQPHFVILSEAKDPLALPSALKCDISGFFASPRMTAWEREDSPRILQ
jgi:hypothetical protein